MDKEEQFYDQDDVKHLIVKLFLLMDGEKAPMCLHALSDTIAHILVSSGASESLIEKLSEHIRKQYKILKPKS